MNAFLNELNDSIAYKDDDVNVDLMHELEEMEKEEEKQETHEELPDVPLDLNLIPETDHEAMQALEE